MELECKCSLSWYVNNTVTLRFIGDLRFEKRMKLINGFIVDK